jgi:hypothetical protein
LPRPFAVGDPGRADFAVRDLAADPERCANAHELRRRSMRSTGLRGAEAQRDHFVAIAKRLSEDPEARSAFDLVAEPADVRQRYGRHRPASRACSRASCRRRSAHGVVSDTGWDHHTESRRR